MLGREIGSFCSTPLEKHRMRKIGPPQPDEKYGKERSCLGCVVFRVVNDLKKALLPSFVVLCDEGEHRLMAFVEFLQGV